MIVLLARACLHLLANAIGLVIATTVLSGFEIDTTALITVTVIFTVVEVVTGPLLISISIKQIPSLMGGIALVTTFIGLLVADLVSDGMSISGVTTWILASLIVWLCSLLAGIILPLFLFKKTLEARKSR